MGYQSEYLVDVVFHVQHAILQQVEPAQHIVRSRVAKAFVHLFKGIHQLDVALTGCTVRVVGKCSDANPSLIVLSLEQISTQVRAILGGTLQPQFGFLMFDNVSVTHVFLNV